MNQNITLSLDREILKKAKVLAAKKDTSVTKLLSEQLARIVKEYESKILFFAFRTDWQVVLEPALRSHSLRLPAEAND